MANSEFGANPRVRVSMVSDAMPGSSLSGDAKIFFNEFQVYGFPFAVNAVDFAIKRIGQVLGELRSLPVRLDGRESCEALLGRHIYYREQPAIIENFDGVGGMLRIRSEIGLFTLEPWASDDAEPQYRLDVDIISPHIHWEGD